jgi:hypothetical protein
MENVNMEAPHKHTYIGLLLGNGYKYGDGAKL